MVSCPMHVKLGCVSNMKKCECGPPRPPVAPSLAGSTGESNYQYYLKKLSDLGSILSGEVDIGVLGRDIMQARRQAQQAKGPGNCHTAASIKMEKAVEAACLAKEIIPKRISTVETSILRGALLGLSPQLNGKWPSQLVLHLWARWQWAVAGDIFKSLETRSDLSVWEDWSKACSVENKVAPASAPEEVPLGQVLACFREEKTSFSQTDLEFFERTLCDSLCIPLVKSNLRDTKPTVHCASLLHVGQEIAAMVTDMPVALNKMMSDMSHILLCCAELASGGYHHKVTYEALEDFTSTTSATSADDTPLQVLRCTVLTDQFYSEKVAEFEAIIMSEESILTDFMADLEAFTPASWTCIAKKVNETNQQRLARQGALLPIMEKLAKNAESAADEAKKDVNKFRMLLTEMRNMQNSAPSDLAKFIAELLVKLNESMRDVELEQKKQALLTKLEEFKGMDVAEVSQQFREEFGKVVNAVPIDMKVDLKVATEFLQKVGRQAHKASSLLGCKSWNA